MGSCLSFHSTYELIDFPQTAMVVTIDGSLIEYLVPANVSQILEVDYSSSYLCRSDELDLGKRILALGSHDLIELGQIYFVLPRSMLNKPLQGKDMAALAVKASLALDKKASRYDKLSRVLPVRELTKNPTDQTYKVSYGLKMFGTCRESQLQSTNGFARNRYHMTRLSTIEE